MGKWVEFLSKRLTQFLNVLLAIFLALMCILVFGNVVLRYVFNTGITWSEEMARFLFIWITFLGAIVALKDNEHLGVDLLIKKLPPALKKGVYVLSHLLILYCLWLVLDGSWKMTILNADAYAPATGLPMSYVYGIGVVMSIGMGAIVLYNVLRVLLGKARESSLRMSRESEELTLLDRNKERVSS